MSQLSLPNQVQLVMIAERPWQSKQTNLILFAVWFCMQNEKTDSKEGMHPRVQRGMEEGGKDAMKGNGEKELRSKHG